MDFSDWNEEDEVLTPIDLSMRADWGDEDGEDWDDDDDDWDDDDDEDEDDDVDDEDDDDL